MVERRASWSRGKGEPEQLRAIFVTPGVLNAVGVQPILDSRAVLQSGWEPKAAGTVLLTYSYWQRRLGGDRSVLGTILNVDGKPRTVIGVMPQDFQFLTSVGGNPAASIRP